MKNVKLFGFLIFSVLLLIGCGTVSASDRVTALLDELVTLEITDFETELDFFEAKLDCFSSIVEILTTEALEMGVEAEVIRLESQDLLKQLITERDDYIQFHNDGFEHHCYEDGGVVVEDELGAIWCDELDGAGRINSERRLNILFYGFEPLILQTMAIEYVLFESLEDFDEMLSDLEAEIDLLEAEFDARLAYLQAEFDLLEAEFNPLLYLEVNDPDLQHQVTCRYCVRRDLRWEVKRDLTDDIYYFFRRLEAVEIGIELNPEASIDRQGRRVADLRSRLFIFL